MDVFNTNKILATYKQRMLREFKEDNDIFLEFIRRRQLEGIGIRRIIKYFDSYFLAKKAIPKKLESWQAEDLENFVLWMQEQGKQDIRSRFYSMKKFLEFRGRGANISIKLKRDRRKLPEELLTREEIAEIINTCTNLRDRAFFALLYESGCRAGEILTLRIKHIIFDQHGTIAVFSGKTGMRRVRIIESTQYLASYLQFHPRREEKNEPLWHRLDNFKKTPTYATMRVLLKRIVKKTKIKKRIHMHLFRHSRATELAKHLTEQQLKVYLGWSAASAMAGVYVHLSGKDVDNAILSLYGKEEREERKINHKCLRCESINHFSARYCGKCGGILHTII